MIVNKRLSVILLSLIVLAGCITTSLIGYYFAKDSVYDHLSKEILPLTSDNVYSEIQRDLLQPTLISSLMAHDTFVHDWYLNGEQSPEKMISYLHQIQHKYNTITAFFVSDRSGKYYHSSGILKTVSPNDPKDSWFYETKASSLPSVINVDFDTADKDRITVFVNYRILDRSGAFIGAIGVGLSLDLVSALIERFQSYYGRNVYFVDREGNTKLKGERQYDLNFHQRNSEHYRRIFSKILSYDSGSLSFKADDGQIVLLNSRYIPEFDWYLIVEQIDSADTVGIEQALLINLIISGLVSLLILYVAYLAIRGYGRKLERMATHDYLTGAVNRQALDDLFHKAVSSSSKKHEALSIVIVDIDHFKKVNDTFGHQAGDQIISGVAKTMSQLLHKGDIMCRWGGEEFLFVLLNSDKDKSITLTETILKRVEDTVFDVGGHDVSVTLSAGVTQLKPNEALSHVIARADDRLYAAKKEGRNTIRSW